MVAVVDVLDLVRRAQHPALAPGVDQPVALRPRSEEGHRHLDDDRVDVDPRLRVLAAVDEAEVAVLVALVVVAVPGVGTGRQLLLHALAVARVLRVEVEQVVALELEQGLRDRQLAAVGPGERHAVELRRVVDRAEEAGQVVEEGVVARTEVELQILAARRGDLVHLVGAQHLGEVAFRKAEKVDVGAVLLVHRDTDLHAALDGVLLRHPLGVAQQRVQGALALAGHRASGARARVDTDAVEHVGVEDAGGGCGGEGEGEHHAVAVGAVHRPAEHVVEIGRAQRDVGEDRVHRVRVVVVGGPGPRAGEDDGDERREKGRGGAAESGALHHGGTPQAPASARMASLAFSAIM